MWTSVWSLSESMNSEKEIRNRIEKGRGAFGKIDIRITILNWSSLKINSRTEINLKCMLKIRWVRNYIYAMKEGNFISLGI